MISPSFISNRNNKFTIFSTSKTFKRYICLIIAIYISITYLEFKIIYKFSNSIASSCITVVKILCFLTVSISFKFVITYLYKCTWSTIFSFSKYIYKVTSTRKTDRKSCSSFIIY